MSNPDMEISRELRSLFERFEKEVESVAGQPMAISVCIFQAVEGSRMNYISNCKREEVIHAWKSLIIGWDKGMPDIPAHEME